MVKSQIYIARISKQDQNKTENFTVFQDQDKIMSKSWCCLIWKIP